MGRPEKDRQQRAQRLRGLDAGDDHVVLEVRKGHAPILQAELRPRADRDEEEDQKRGVEKDSQEIFP